MNMDLQIEGKVFMVAAASKGLGFGIARELAKNGATVCITSRSSAGADLQSVLQSTDWYNLQFPA